MKLPVKFGLAVVVSLVLLTVAAATPTAAQQAASPEAPAETSAVQAGSPSAPLLGPRLPPEMRGLEPSTIGDRSVTAPPVAAARSNTIVISTLSLVLIAVIVTILVVT
jgi:hypothetical protein